MVSLHCQVSSIGNGGINTKCAKTTNMEKCAKIPRSNPKVKNFRNAKVKSQGQECQGQECVECLECAEWEI